MASPIIFVKYFHHANACISKFSNDGDSEKTAIPLQRESIHQLALLLVLHWLKTVVGLSIASGEIV